MKTALTPAPKAWPHCWDPRVTRDGSALVVQGTSTAGPAAAVQDAHAALQGYLETLKLPQEQIPRETRIKAALGLAQPVPSRDERGAYTATLRYDLKSLQQVLNTDYE